MRAIRRQRGWLSAWLIAAMLFMQLAAAAHACAQVAQAKPAGMTGMPDCPHHRAAAATAERDGAALCKVHCEAGLQSVDSQAGALDAPHALALPAAWLGSVADGAADAGLVRPEALAAGPPAPHTPIYLSLLVLRN